jgi:hypothetical protein
VPITCRADAFNRDHPTSPIITAFVNSLITSIILLCFSDSLPASHDHRFLSSLPPLPEGSAVPEANLVTESEPAETASSPEVDEEDGVDFEASQTRASPPSATPRGEMETEKKRKRLEAADSESSGETHLTLMIPRVAVPPSSLDIEDPFDLV